MSLYDGFADVETEAGAMRSGFKFVDPEKFRKEMFDGAGGNAAAVILDCGFDAASA